MEPCGFVGQFDCAGAWAFESVFADGFDAFVAMGHVFYFGGGAVAEP